MPTDILFTHSGFISQTQRSRSRYDFRAGEQSQCRQTGLEAPRDLCLTQGPLFSTLRTPGCLINSSLARLPKKLCDQGPWGGEQGRALRSLKVTWLLPSPFRREPELLGEGSQQMRRKAGSSSVPARIRIPKGSYFFQMVSLSVSHRSQQLLPVGVSAPGLQGMGLREGRQKTWPFSPCSLLSPGVP